MPVRPITCVAVLALLASSVLADDVSIAVPARAIAPGQVITSDMLTTKTIDSGQVYASTLQADDELVGQQATKPLRAMQPVNRLHVKPATDVNRNTLVTVIYRRPGLELTGSGQALEDGRIGETIRVLNPDSKATLIAKVVSANQVEVQ